METDLEIFIEDYTEYVENITNDEEDEEAEDEEDEAEEDEEDEAEEDEAEEVFTFTKSELEAHDLQVIENYLRAQGELHLSKKRSTKDA